MYDSASLGGAKHPKTLVKTAPLSPMGPRPGRRAPPAKRRRLLLHGRAVGFSPFFRSLSGQLLGPVPRSHPRASSLPTASASKGESPARAAPALKRSKLVRRRAEPLLNESSSDDESDLDDDDEEEEEEEQDDTMEETVEVDFEFFDPRPDDFHGVKLLLRSYLGDRQWDLGGFVDLILEQTTVGTVVKLNRTEEEEDQEDDDDNGGRGAQDDEEPYAVISALNLGRYASHQCIKELKEYLIERCHENGVKNKFQSMLEGQQAHSTGLLVCERFVNFPLQPLPHLYDALFDEVSWATEDEKTQEIRDSFHFKYYLLLTRIFVKKDADIVKGRSLILLGKKKKSSNASKERNFDSDEPIVYTKAEDELFHKLCSLSFTFGFPREEQVAPPELKNYKEMGLVMIVESNKVSTFREEVKTFLTET